MESHLTHINSPFRKNTGDDVNRCQICKEPIWGSQWPTANDSQMRQFVCFYCFSKLRDGDYKPVIPEKSNLTVCDRCGKVSADFKIIKFECLCEECRE